MLLQTALQQHSHKASGTAQCGCNLVFWSWVIMFGLKAFTVFENTSLASTLPWALQCGSMQSPGVRNLKEFGCPTKGEEVLDTVKCQEMWRAMAASSVSPHPGHTSDLQLPVYSLTPYAKAPWACIVGKSFWGMHRGQVGGRVKISNTPSWPSLTYWNAGSLWYL